MKRVILIVALVGIVMGCKRQPEVFEYTLRGTVTGKESGEFFLSESPRLGDEIKVFFQDYAFEIQGTAPFMHSTLIFADLNLENATSVIIEPGEIVLELNWDEFSESVIVSGQYNEAAQKAQQQAMSLFGDSDFNSEEIRQQIGQWLIDHSGNLYSINSISSWERNVGNFMDLDQLKEFITSVKDPILKGSLAFIELVSVYNARKDGINAVGNAAMNFRLPDQQGELIDFHSVSTGKLTYVEKSGSWCGNSTRNTRSLLPVYEKYKDMGLEIITVVPESRPDRWHDWLKKEQFPWVNLIESDTEVARREFSFSETLFREGNYLVDQEGVVMATGLSAASLNELLMKHFEPEAYEKYLAEKWEMPANVYILDKEQPVQSFNELKETLSGRPFLIDCWATWCSPCFDEFEYNSQLKAFLETKDMVVVYINFDQPENEAQWISTIRDKHLQGYHVRINDALANDLMSLGFAGMLPTYMIINEKGEMVESNAFRPSQTDKLYTQISTLIH